MAFLEQFSRQEKDLIVSVPYRVGVWVSSVDAAGGAVASYQEQDSLETIIAEKSSGMFESAFMHEVMAETCTRQQDWKAWGENMDKVLAECGEAVRIVSAKLEEKDVDAYRHTVMTIAVDVAKAFREFDSGASFMVRLWTKYRLFLESLCRVVKRDKSLETQGLLNISYEEDAALSKLAKALHGGAGGGFSELTDASKINDKGV